MPAVWKDLHNGIDSRTAQAPVVGDRRLYLAEVVNRLDEKCGGRFGVDRILRAKLHADPVLPRVVWVLPLTEVPRIDRQLKVGTAREIVCAVDARVKALAPVRRNANGEVRAGGEADDADTARIDGELRGVAAKKAYRTLHVAKRRLALVGCAVD